MAFGQNGKERPSTTRSEGLSTEAWNEASRTGSASYLSQEISRLTEEANPYINEFLRQNRRLEKYWTDRASGFSTSGSTMGASSSRSGSGEGGIGGGNGHRPVLDIITVVDSSGSTEEETQFGKKFIHLEDVLLALITDAQKHTTTHEGREKYGRVRNGTLMFGLANDAQSPGDGALTADGHSIGKFVKPLGRSLDEAAHHGIHAIMREKSRKYRGESTYLGAALEVLERHLSGETYEQRHSKGRVETVKTSEALQNKSESAIVYVITDGLLHDVPRDLVKRLQDMGVFVIGIQVVPPGDRRGDAPSHNVTREMNETFRSHAWTCSSPDGLIEIVKQEADKLKAQGSTLSRSSSGSRAGSGSRYQGGSGSGNPGSGSVGSRNSGSGSSGW